LNVARLGKSATYFVASERTSGATDVEPLIVIVVFACAAGAASASARTAVRAARIGTGPPGVADEAADTESERRRRIVNGR
jgi:hypothetical protein